MFEVEKLQVENWFPESTSVKFSEYWNDEEYEDTFNIADENYGKLEKYLEEQGFFDDLGKATYILNKRGLDFQGKGLELAAGILWLTSYLLRHFLSITNLTALEISKSRLLKFGPKLLEHYKIDTEKLKLVLGSFYEIKLPDHSLDFIVLAQAFHHADDPGRLLKEMSRVLKKDGFVVMIGELFIPKKLYLKCYVHYIISCLFSHLPILNMLKNYWPFLKKFSVERSSFQEIYFPPDSRTGDHYHLESQYRRLFRDYGFKFIKVPSKLNNHLSYILIKP